MLSLYSGITHCLSTLCYSKKRSVIFGKAITNQHKRKARIIASVAKDKGLFLNSGSNTFIQGTKQQEWFGQEPKHIFLGIELFVSVIVFSVRMFVYLYVYYPYGYRKKSNSMYLSLFYYYCVKASIIYPNNGSQINTKEYI